MTDDPVIGEKVVREYSYSGGLLAAAPRYWWPSYSEEASNGNTLTRERFVTRSAFPLQDAGGHVTYEMVTESLPGNGKTKTVFTGYYDGPNTSYIESIQPQPYLHSAYSTLAHRRGLPKEFLVYDEGGNLLRREVNQYEELPVLGGPQEIRAVRFNTRRAKIGEWFIHEGASYTINILPYRITSKSVYEYGTDGQGTVHYKSDHEYDSEWALPVSEELTYEDDGTEVKRKTTRTYAFNHYWTGTSDEEGAITEMLARHMIGIPLRTAHQVDGNQVSASWTEMNIFPNDHILPKKAHRFYPGEGWRQEAEVTGYTDDSFPLGIVRTGWQPEYYTWQDGLLTKKQFGSWEWEWDWDFDGNRKLTKYTDIDDQYVIYEYDGWQLVGEFQLV